MGVTVATSSSATDLYELLYKELEVQQDATVRTHDGERGVISCSGVQQQ